MNIIEVQNKHTARDFLGIPKEIYRHDPYRVCPLDQEIEAIFDPMKHRAFPERGSDTLDTCR